MYFLNKFISEIWLQADYFWIFSTIWNFNNPEFNKKYLKAVKNLLPWLKTEKISNIPCERSQLDYRDHLLYRF